MRLVPLHNDCTYHLEPFIVPDTYEAEIEAQRSRIEADPNLHNGILRTATKFDEQTMTITAHDHIDYATLLVLRKHGLMSMIGAHIILFNENDEPVWAVRAPHLIFPNHIHWTAGGAVDHGETGPEACWRELGEEAGLGPDDLVDGIHHWGFLQTDDEYSLFFHGRLKPGVFPNVTDENIDYKIGRWPSNHGPDHPLTQEICNQLWHMSR